jgi:hypothetical protein
MNIREMYQMKQAIIGALRNHGARIDGRYMELSTPNDYTIQASIPLADDMQVQMASEHNIARIRARQVQNPGYRGKGTAYFLVLKALYETGTNKVMIFGSLVRVETAQILRKRHVRTEAKRFSMQRGIVRLISLLDLGLKPPAH